MNDCMKKSFFLLLSLLMVVFLLAACDKQGDLPTETDTQAMTDDVQTEPETQEETVVDTLPETTPETLPETESETLPSNDTGIDDLLDDIMQNQPVDVEEDCRIDTEIKLDITAGMNGMDTNMSMTGGVTFIQQKHQGMAVEMNIPTQEPYSFIYIDGVLFVANAEGKYRCPLDEVEMALVWSELMGDLFPMDSVPEGGEEGSLTGGFSDLLSTMKISALFAEKEMVTDETTGDITVTLKGLSNQAQFLINMMISSIDKLPTDEISDMDMSLLLDLFSTFDMDALMLTLTVDQQQLLKAMTVTMTMDMTNAPDLVGDVPMKMTMTATTLFDRAVQTVTPPADADIYEEIDWRTLFGIYTAEMLELVPDEQGVITLSENPDTFALQYDYLMEHSEEFSGAIFSVTARAGDFIRNDDGTVQGIIYQVYEDGSPAYYPYLYVLIPEEIAVDMTLPEDESTIRLTTTLIIAEDGETYYDLLAQDFELISGPVAVG